MGKRLGILAAAILGICAAAMPFADPVFSGELSNSAGLPAKMDGHVTPAALIAPAPAGEKKPASSAAPPTAKLTPGQILYNRTHDASTMDPVSWSVLVHKTTHQLIVYYKSHVYRKYRAVFGRNPDNGAKEYANDRRTPEGVYTITKKHRSRHFTWFLKLNYPNLIDRMRYRKLRAAGIVPVDDDGRVPPIGDSIGIHGTDVPILNQGLVNWTTGCISVSNEAIAELDRLLPVGTVVVIEP